MGPLVFPVRLCVSFIPLFLPVLSWAAEYRAHEHAYAHNSGFSCKVIEVEVLSKSQ